MQISTKKTNKIHFSFHFLLQVPTMKLYALMLIVLFVRLLPSHPQIDDDSTVSLHHLNSLIILKLHIFFRQRLCRTRQLVRPIQPAQALKLQRQLHDMTIQRQSKLFLLLIQMNPYF